MGPALPVPLPAIIPDAGAGDQAALVEELSGDMEGLVRPNSCPSCTQDAMCQ